MTAEDTAGAPKIKKILKVNLPSESLFDILNPFIILGSSSVISFEDIFSAFQKSNGNGEMESQ
jgi:hypothetical protein